MEGNTNSCPRSSTRPPRTVSETAGLNSLDNKSGEFGKFVKTSFSYEFNVYRRETFEKFGFWDAFEISKYWLRNSTPIPLPPNKYDTSNPS